MEDFKTASFHLNTIFKLPDVVSWQLTERTDSWINVHWLEKRSIVEAVIAENEFAKAGLNREQLNYVQVCFRSLPDPTDLDLKKVCQLLHHNSKNKGNVHNRPLVHYNGHSIEPSNTREKQFSLNDDRYSGEIKQVDASQVEQWLGMPATFIYDCDSAGRFLEDLSAENPNLHLASCGADQKLPFNQKDLFSRVLLRPVQTALECHFAELDILIKMEELYGLLGNARDKKSVLGQLNWILLLLTDTMAYSSLSAEQFGRLFREDVLVGTLWRRFILAQRILRTSSCLPISQPPIPDCSANILWSFWDTAIDKTLKLLLFEGKNEETLVDQFFHNVLAHSVDKSLPLVLEALLITKHSLKAMDILQRKWTTMQSDSYLLENLMTKLSRLLVSENAELFDRTVEFLVQIVRQDITLGRHLPAFSCDYLNRNLALKSNDDHILKQLFLQVVIVKSEQEGKLTNKPKILENCFQFLDHSVAEIRMLTLFLVSTASENLSLVQTEQIHNLLEDPSPKVRAAALEAWIAANGSSVRGDIVTNKVVSMIFENYSLLMRRKLIYELNSIAVEKLPELVAVSKQGSNNSIDMMKTNKAKSKSKQKKCTQQNKTVADAICMAKVWRVINIFSSDPDPETASAMQFLVSFVKQRSADLDAGGKKTPKKKTATEKNQPSLLTRKEPFIEQALQALFEKSSHTEVVMTNGECETPLDISADIRINHQLRSFQTPRAPELIRLGPHQQLAFAYKDRVVWQNLSEDCSYNLKAANSTGDSCSTVSSLLFVKSTTSSARLLVGHSNGVVRIWQSDLLIGSWQALYDLDGFGSSKSPANSKGLLLCALSTNQIVTAGETKQIRVWDLTSEMMTTDISTGVDQPVTALVSQNRQNIFAGFADGTIRIFDLRTATNGRAALTAKHSKSVCSIGIQDDHFTVISACIAGTVNVTDWRKPSNPVKVWHYEEPVSDIAIHEKLQLVAGSAEAVDVRSVHGEELYKVYRTDSDGSSPVEGARKRPPSSVAFHPTKPMMCTGYRDNTAVLYGVETVDTD